jgi:hypothetical protein
MEQASERAAAPQASSVTPRWDLTGMSSAYCNVASATSLRDAVAVNLGVTQRDGARAPAELKVELLHRVVLTALAAKHLHQMLGRLLGEHDAQRGGRR